MKREVITIYLSILIWVFAGCNNGGLKEGKENLNSFPNSVSSTIEPPKGELPPKDVEVYDSSSSHSIKEWFIGRPIGEVIQDMNGNIWFSDLEQFYGLDYCPANWIGRLNPQTGEVKIWTIPQATGFQTLRLILMAISGWLRGFHLLL